MAEIAQMKERGLIEELGRLHERISRLENTLRGHGERDNTGRLLEKPVQADGMADRISQAIAMCNEAQGRIEKMTEDVAYIITRL
jgi:phage shock protein A